MEPEQRVNGFTEGEGLGGKLVLLQGPRFGCLSKAAAIVIYNVDNISEFLEQFPDINNILACLVREVMDLPYLRAVLVVLVTLGLQLVEHFYAITIKE